MSGSYGLPHSRISGIDAQRIPALADRKEFYSLATAGIFLAGRLLFANPDLANRALF